MVLLIFLFIFSRLPEVCYRDQLHYILIFPDRRLSKDYLQLAEMIFRHFFINDFLLLHYSKTPVRSLTPLTDGFSKECAAAVQTKIVLHMKEVVYTAVFLYSRADSSRGVLIMFSGKKDSAKNLLSPLLLHAKCATFPASHLDLLSDQTFDVQVNVERTASPRFH